MTCARGHEKVFWAQRGYPCWMCGDAGVPSPVPATYGAHRHRPDARPDVPERVRL